MCRLRGSLYFRKLVMKMDEKKKSFVRVILGLLGFIILVTADQLTKHYAETSLMGQDRVLIPDVLRFTYAENTGIAWSLFSDAGTLVLSAVTAVLLVYVAVLWLRLCRFERCHILRFLLVLIAAGGAGNLMDRVFRGYVIDFIYFELIRFPVFNIADCCITIGVFALIISFLTIYRGEDADLLFPFGKKRKP